MLVDVTLDPILARVGPCQIGWSGVLLSLGMLVALGLGWQAARRRGLPERELGRVAVWIVVGGLIGARLLHVADHFSYFVARPLASVAIDDGGGAHVGALVGGSVFGLLAARRARLPLWSLLDAVAPAVLVGETVAWVGCLASGAVWGLPTNGTWGIVYWNPHDLLPPSLLGVPTHPYPLYEIAGNALLFVGVGLGRPWLARREGRLFLAVAVAYSVIQFGLAFFRPASLVVAGLHASQVVSLGLAAIAGSLLVGQRRHSRHPDLPILQEGDVWCATTG